MFGEMIEDSVTGIQLLLILEAFYAHSRSNDVRMKVYRCIIQTVGLVR